jgi:hypothetical protein
MVELSSTKAPADWVMSIAMGKVPGHSFAAFQGTNLDVDLGTLPEDLIPLGGSYAWLTGNTQLQVVSDNAADTAAGTGARTVLIVGLNAAGAVLTEVVSLNGITPVNTVNLYYRVNGFQCVTAGSAGTNVGMVRVQQLGGTPTSIIPGGYGRSQTGVYTIPGKTGWIVDGFFSMVEITNATNFLSMQLLIRTNPQLDGAWISRTTLNISSGLSTVTLQPRAIGPALALSDITLRTFAVGNNNTQGMATLSLILTDNA